MSAVFSQWNDVNLNDLTNECQLFDWNYEYSEDFRRVARGSHAERELRVKCEQFGQKGVDIFLYWKNRSR